MQWFISARMQAAGQQPLLLYTRIGAKAPAPALPYTAAAYNPAENTHPARKYSRIPVLGVSNNPIQFGLLLDTDAQLAARVQAWELSLNRRA